MYFHQLGFANNRSYDTKGMDNFGTLVLCYLDFSASPDSGLIQFLGCAFPPGCGGVVAEEQPINWGERSPSARSR